VLKISEPFPYIHGCNEMRMIALLVSALIAGIASAQTTVVVQDPYAGFADTIKRNREQAEATGRQAGQIVNNALRKPQAVALILILSRSTTHGVRLGGAGDKAYALYAESRKLFTP
jgi:hypothetical protein